MSVADTLELFPDAKACGVDIVRISSASIVPIEIDPRPCGLCGLTIDRHDMVDAGEEPEFFCPDSVPRRDDAA
jgi:hypothetical protein